MSHTVLNGSAHLSCMPCPELVHLLLPAYEPCSSFTTDCAGIARWQPNTGHVPRGFVGAFGTLDDVALVLVVAEPGDPLSDEDHERGDATAIVDAITTYAYGRYEDCTTLFHKNMRRILDLCWPGESLRDQLTKTWITESYLCSAPTETGPVAIQSTRACANRFLRPQLDLLRDRPVIALGGKAQQRTIGLHPNVIPAWAAAPPGANRPQARISWGQAAGTFRQASSR